MTGSADRDTLEMVGLWREGRLTAFAARAGQKPAIDIADVIIALAPADRADAIRRLLPAHSGPVLLEMPRHEDATQILAQLDDATALALLIPLGDDDVAELLHDCERGRRDGLVAQLPHAEAIARLLAQDRTTAAGLMTARMTIVAATDTAQFAIESVRRQASSVADLFDILVVDGERRLVGLLPVGELVLLAATVPVRDVMVAAPVSVSPSTDDRAIYRLVERYSLTSVPVVDASGRLLGRVPADAVRHLSDHAAAAELLRFGGVSPALDELSWKSAVRSRLPSLYLSLLGAFGAAAVVSLFKDVIIRVVALAVWMPVVAGVGGNAGTQALAAAIRRDVSGRRRARIAALLRREVLIGSVNGAAIGLAVSGVSILLGESWRFGAVVLTAITANLALASVMGVLLPDLLRRFGRDPSHASPVIVTALTDALAFALLLGLAARVLL